jgi:hypothetical protein
MEAILKTNSETVVTQFLPAGKKAAIIFSMDDVHPGKSTDPYEAGGDLEKGALGLVENLMNRHPELNLTIFLTADWRMINPFPTRKLLSKIPVLRDYVYLADVLPKGTMQLRKHIGFVQYLKQLPNTDIAFHGLHHVHKGLKTNLEFQEQTREAFQGILSEIEAEFLACGLKYTKGLCPPNWLAPEALVQAMVDFEFNYLASARDLFTPISPGAKANMSGLKGVSLIYPQKIMDNNLIHIPANFNATRNIDRAIEIIENKGVLSIKAHIAKSLAGHILYDGVDEVYMNYLDTLLRVLKNKYGDQLWFPSLNELAVSAKSVS